MNTISLFSIIVTTLKAANINCYNASQCVGDQLVTNNSDSIWSYGYKASSSNQSSMDSAANAECGGSFCCFDSSFIKSSSTTYCDGSNSCSSSFINNIGLIDTFGAEIWCYGSNSCQESDLRTAGAEIRCHADQSCAYTNINIQDTTNIKAFGAYSMMYTNISTPNSNVSINISFYGYMSGYRANITCQSTDKCNIKCYNNACYLIYIDCRGDCSITNESYSANLIAIDSIIYSNKSSFELIYNSQTLTTNADKQCNQQPNSITYDNYPGNYQGADIIGNGGPICCRGGQSCRDVNIIQLNDTNQHAIVCSGYWGCYNVGSIISNGPIICDGMSSCFETDMITTNDIHCFGTWSCYSCNISNATNIYCSGWQSCVGISIQSSGTINIYLLGFESGLNMSMICNVGDECKTFCQGLDGCEGATYIPSSSPTTKPSVSPLITTYSPSQSAVDLTTLSSPSSHPKCLPDDIGWINTTYEISTMQQYCIIYLEHHLVVSSNITEEELKRFQDIMDEPQCGNTTVNIYSCFNSTMTGNAILNVTNSIEFMDDINDMIDNNNNTNVKILKIQYNYYESGEEVNERLYWIIIILSSSIVALCVIIIGIVFYYKGRNKKERRKKQMLISNPMVILLAVGEYDDDPKDGADELAAVYLRNLNIDKDIEHLHSIFGKDMLNYNISPHYKNLLIPKLYWTQKQIINLLKSKAAELDKNGEYDGLIVAISSHGIPSHICCSDYRLISKVAIHRLFTTNYKRAREIPRIFLYDGCDGNEERDGYFGRGSSSEAKQGKPADIKGKPPLNKIDDNKEDEKEEEEDKEDGDELKEEEYAKTFTEYNIVQTYGTIWARNTRSVDYKLAQIHAANPGFQAKCSSDLGSYMLYEFVKTMSDDLKKNNGKTTKFLMEITNEIQEKLENKGTQHIVVTFQDKTGFIIFKRNNKKEIKSNIEMSEFN